MWESWESLAMCFGAMKPLGSPARSLSLGGQC